MLSNIFVCVLLVHMCTSKNPRPLLPVQFERTYDPDRNPSFCDRVLIANHHPTLNIESVRYDSIQQGIIELSDHDLVYQIIRVREGNPLALPLDKTMLIISWNFGKAAGALKSYMNILEQLEQRIFFLHEIDILFFSFQESVSSSFRSLIRDVYAKLPSMYHVQTVESGSSVDCVRCGYKVYGVLFMRMHSDARYQILSASRKLVLSWKALGFAEKSAAFTSMIQFADGFNVIFIAAHFPRERVQDRIKALWDVYKRAGGDREVLLILAGDLNFRQSESYSENPFGYFRGMNDELTYALATQRTLWRELAPPMFLATCKRKFRHN